MAPKAGKLRNVEKLSVLFSDIDPGTLEAILDHHGNDILKARHSLTAMGAEETEQSPGEKLLLRFETCQTRNKHENCVQLSQITFFSNHAPLSLRSVRNPGGSNPGNEGPKNIMDGSTRTKWLDFRKCPLIMELEDPSVIPDSYVLVTANDMPNRDPVRWRLEQSTDNGRSWHLVDDRSNGNHEVPRSRFMASPIFCVGGGTAGTSRLRGTAVPMSDRDLIAQWTDPNTARPAEFADTLASICIVPELMGTSCMEHKIARLEEEMRLHPDRLRESFDTAAARFVGRAFGIDSIQRARQFNGSDPGDISQYGNFHRSFVMVYNDLDEWQKPLLQMALAETLSHDDNSAVDGLQVLCGLFLRASRECMARKHHAFMVAIHRSLSDDVAHVDRGSSQLRATASVFENHKQNLYHAAQVALDELKDKAFKSVFVEPTKLYFHAVGDFVMEGDVEVHGSNTYLALLLAALGIKLARSPLFDDEVKGVVSFFDCLDRNDMNMLWDVQNLSKHWEAIVGRRARVSQRVRHNQFYFQGRNAREVASDCLGSSIYSKSCRCLMKPYLDAFAKYFSQQFVVERLCNTFLANEEVKPSIQAIFRGIASSQEVEDADESALYWLWDPISGKFHNDRGLLLLRAAGICQPSV
jgi:hypothetical protein